MVREGDDLTVVTWGMLAVYAYELAETLRHQGISVEVIDLRTLAPYDFDTVLASLKKTGKVLVAHEAPLTAGLGGEIAARCAEEGFEYLDAPVRRLAGLDCPVAFSKVLEDEILPQKSDLERAIRELAEY